MRSIAFHPNFETNHKFYVTLVEERASNSRKHRYLFYSSRRAAADSVLLEWRVFPGSKTPNPATLREVLRVSIPVLDHPIKQIAFHGRYLYIGHGDGSVQSASAGGGQGNDALGKILKINPLRGRNGEPYTVPKSNPFKKSKKYLPEIFAVGFRNPHNLCFSKSGELFVADAGRDNVEEINIVKAGRNYGWSLREGPFIHLNRGGLGNGVKPLPDNDQENNLTYPNIALGHIGQRGWGFSQAKQAIAGSCPIENGSILNGVILFSNFPSDGKLYYSLLTDARNAVTKGPPKMLRSAKMFLTKLYFNHDGNPRTRNKRVQNLRDIIRFDPNMKREDRADVRFGQGSNGEIYWSSKANGKIYLIETTLPK